MPPRTTALRLEFKNLLHWKANCNSQDFLNLITKTKQGEQLVALCETQEVQGKLQVNIKYQKGTSVYESVVLKFCKKYKVKLQDPSDWRPFSEEDADSLVLQKVQPVAVVEGEEEANFRDSGDRNFNFYESTDFRDAPSTNVSNASTDTQLKEEVETLKRENQKLRKDLEDMRTYQEKSEAANRELKIEVEKMKNVMDAAMQRYNLFLTEEESLKDSKRRLNNDCIYYETLLKENGINPLHHMDKYPKNL